MTNLRNCNLSNSKKQKYDELCNKIHELIQELEHSGKEKRDASDIIMRLEIELDKCFKFIRSEIYKN